MKIAAAPVDGHVLDPVEGAGRDRVAASLLTEGPATASQLAERLGISATAVRRHLESLAVEGAVEASERPPYGPPPTRGRGRPARTFSLTAEGRARFPADYDALAVDALGFLAQVGGDDAVHTFAQRRASELEQRLVLLLGEDWSAQPQDQQISAFAQALSELGYAASTDPAPGGVQVCQHHCPVSHVATRFPQLCEAETEAFARLLGHHVQRLATIAHGDGVCTTVIPLTSHPTERTPA